MNDLGARIQDLRRAAKLSQTELADKIGISKSQMIRYESKGAQPPADILNRLADIFGTSIDYLINGNTNQKAVDALKNTKILQRFKEIEQLPDHEQNVIIEVVTAYIRDFKAKQNYAV